MIKIIYRMFVKSDREKEFRNLATKILIPEARRNKGCLLFSLYENYTSPGEFILYELWKDKKAVNAYIKQLIRILGKNSPGNEFPDTLNDFFEKDEDLLYEETKNAIGRIY